MTLSNLFTNFNNTKMPKVSTAHYGKTEMLNVFQVQRRSIFQQLENEFR